MLLITHAGEKKGELRQIKKVTKKIKLLPHEQGLQGIQHQFTEKINGEGI